MLLIFGEGPLVIWMSTDDGGRGERCPYGRRSGGGLYTDDGDVSPSSVMMMYKLCNN